MKFDAPDDLADFERTKFTAHGITHPVFLLGPADAPPIIYIHEMPQITPEVAWAARALAKAGFRVIAPSLLGEPGQLMADAQMLPLIWRVCVRREFRAFFNPGVTRPVVQWLRALAVSEIAGGATKVGVIGMCFSGGFALAAAAEAPFVAAASCQPSLPVFPKASIDVSDADLARVRERLDAGEVSVVGYRFEGDTIASCAKFQTIADKLGSGFEGRCLPDACADPAMAQPPHHSVITCHLIDEPGQPTRAALDEILAVMDWRLRDGPQPPAPHASFRDCATHGCARAQAG